MSTNPIDESSDHANVSDSSSSYHDGWSSSATENSDQGGDTTLFRAFRVACGVLGRDKMGDVADSAASLHQHGAALEADAQASAQHSSDEESSSSSSNPDGDSDSSNSASPALETLPTDDSLDPFGAVSEMDEQDQLSSDEESSSRSSSSDGKSSSSSSASSLPELETSSDSEDL
jgi:hypothetical protein